MTGRLFDPAPRAAGAAPHCAAGGDCIRPPPPISRELVGRARHAWALSTGYIIPDRRQPLYGLKQVGFVEHRLEPDGRHESRLVHVPGLATPNIADFRSYGPI
jgi:3',5'-cyclic-AMP phosphodiesterase